MTDSRTRTGGRRGAAQGSPLHVVGRLPHVESGQTRSSSGTVGFGEGVYMPRRGRRGSSRRASRAAPAAGANPHDGPHTVIPRGGEASSRPGASAEPRTLRGCSGEAGRWQCTSPTAAPTLPDARTPLSRRLPLRLWQHGARPQREQLGVVIMTVESGYTQQNIQPRQRLDATRSGVRSGGREVHLVCTQRLSLRAQGNAGCGRGNPSLSRRTATDRAWGPGCMFIGRMAAGPRHIVTVRGVASGWRRGGAQGTATPPEREPLVSRADGGKVGREASALAGSC